MPCCHSATARAERNTLKNQTESLPPVLGRPVSPDDPAAVTGVGFPQTVEGAVDPSPATIQYVRVDHRGLDVLVPQQHGGTGDQGRQAGGELDPSFLSSVPGK